MKIKGILYYIIMVQLIASIIMSIVVIIIPPTSIKNMEIKSTKSESEYFEHGELTQYFESQIDQIQSISLSLPNKKNNLTVEIYDNVGKLLEKSYIRDLKDNQSNVAHFKNLKNVKNKLLIMKIKSDDTISINLNNNYNKNQYLIVNNKKLNKSLTFNYLGKSIDRGIVWYFLVSIFVSLLLFIYLYDERRAYEKKYK